MLGSHAAPLITAIVRFAAQWLLLLPVALTLWAIAVRKKWRFDIVEAAVAGALTIAFVKIAGASYSHGRPFVIDHVAPLIPHAADNSFPSDHLAACGLAFGYLWTRNQTCAALVALCAVLIGAARVSAGLHWPVDVVIGFALGGLASLTARFAIVTASKMRIEVKS